MTNLEKIFYNMDKLSDDWQDSGEVREALNKIESTIGKKAYRKYENAILDYGSQNCKNGFIQGFRYAISLSAGNEIAAPQREKGTNVNITETYRRLIVELLDEVSSIKALRFVYGYLQVHIKQMAESKHPEDE